MGIGSGSSRKDGDQIPILISCLSLVVEQVATWRGQDGGVTDPEVIASSFEVENGLVSRTVRYGSLTEALAATGLTLSNEIPAAAGAAGPLAIGE